MPYVPQFHFNLIPKILVANPTLEMTVFTELTDYGRGLAPATPEAPVYYEARDGGQQSLGYAMAGDQPPPREELEKIMERSLASAGYLPATGTHRPGLALVYFWGSHNRIDPDLANQFPELARNYVLERATLVGGRTYAGKLVREFDDGFIDLDVSPKKAFFRGQVADDLYFVVVSAYAYDELAHDQRRLVWRTTMTVNTRGVSMGEGLPPLIVTAGNFFGRATDEPLAIKREVRRGTVKLGPMYVLEMNVPQPAGNGK